MYEHVFMEKLKPQKTDSTIREGSVTGASYFYTLWPKIQRKKIRKQLC